MTPNPQLPSIREWMRQRNEAAFSALSTPDHVSQVCKINGTAHADVGDNYFIDRSILPPWPIMTNSTSER